MTTLLTILSILRVAFVGDPQVDNERELSYARSSIYSELRARTDLDYVVVLGDIVNENPSLIGPSEQSLDSLHCPWIRVQGNHDGQAFPADTTFMLGPVRFFMLNRYSLREGRADIPDSTSLRILEGIVPGQKTVVCSHVPIDKKITDLYGPDVLFVSAHLHTVFRDTSKLGAGLLGAGASCGSWWRGLPAPDGIPNATMNCGAPRCYFVAGFKASASPWYKLEFKAVNRPADFQCSAAATDSTLTFDVFGGAPWGRLSAKLGGRWVDVPYESVVAPEVLSVRAYNNSKSKEYRRAHKDEFIPMLGWKSPHTWRIILSSPLEADFVKVRYSDSALKFRGKVKVTY